VWQFFFFLWEGSFQAFWFYWFILILQSLFGILIYWNTNFNSIFWLITLNLEVTPRVNQRSLVVQGWHYPVPSCVHMLYFNMALFGVYYTLCSNIHVTCTYCIFGPSFRRFRWVMGLTGWWSPPLQWYWMMGKFAVDTSGNRRQKWPGPWVPGFIWVSA
jgi:hypothetical protein